MNDHQHPGPKPDDTSRGRALVTLAAHRLKDPLVALRQCLEMLSEEAGAALPPEAERWLERARARADQALDTVDDWLDLRRFEEAEGGATEHRSSLVEVVRRVMEEVSPLASAAGVTVTAQGAHEEILVPGERSSLAVALLHLVENGVKYNRRGGSVVVRVTPRSGDVTLEVADNGPGIPPDEIPKLFMPFHRGTGGGRPVAGSGLGLALSAAIVREIGGHMDVDSTLGQGSRFRIHLPRLTGEGASQDQ